MELNPDCIRDILLEIEVQTGNEQVFYYADDIHEKFVRLSKYSVDTIMYHIRQCSLSELIYNPHWTSSTSVYIQDLSPAGHEFLTNIRNDTFYNKVKDIGKELGLTSLNDLVQIAANCAVMVIKSHFNLL